MYKVYCSQCEYFDNYGTCEHPANKKDSYYAPKEVYKWFPVEKNKDNNCELFEAKKPNILKRIWKNVARYCN